MDGRRCWQPPLDLQGDPCRLRRRAALLLMAPSFAPRLRLADQPIGPTPTSRRPPSQRSFTRPAVPGRDVGDGSPVAPRPVIVSPCPGPVGATVLAERCGVAVGVAVRVGEYHAAVPAAVLGCRHHVLIRQGIRHQGSASVGEVTSAGVRGWLPVSPRAGRRSATPTASAIRDGGRRRAAALVVSDSR
jgi:hypothetical protein